MPKFLAIYTGTPGARPQPDQATIARGIQAWGEWAARYAGQIVEGGGPVGKTKRVSTDGVTDISNHIAAYVVVEAADHDAAARMFEGHPHFTIFPGDGVEVMPVLAVPGS
jgi:hypothetical protein